MTVCCQTLTSTGIWRLSVCIPTGSVSYLKFASVQDRFREWKPEVLAKLQVFSCMAIKALDFDAIRVDKATQVTVDALCEWASGTRACTYNLGKQNFLITGEVTDEAMIESRYM